MTKPDKTVTWRWQCRARRLTMDDPLFEEGNIVCAAARKQVATDVLEETLESVKSVSTFVCQVARCNKEFDSVAKYEMHYNNIHKNVCNECHQAFPTSHLLEIHIVESHDVMFTLLAEKQNMYQCLVQSCVEKFKTAGSRKEHMVFVHQYPSNFRFDRPHRPKVKKDKAKPQSAEKMEEDLQTTNTPDVDDDASKMDASSSAAANTSGRKFSYKVPDSICFGQGVSQGFYRGRGRGRGRGKRGRTKHWHQEAESNIDTAVHIEDVNMSELGKALDAQTEATTQDS